MEKRKTNGEIFALMNPDEKKEFKEQYRNHPLAAYIDWKAFYDSSDGNTFDFIKYLGKYKNEDGNLIYILDRIEIDDYDYYLVFVCGENQFYKMPLDEEAEAVIENG